MHAYAATLLTVAGPLGCSLQGRTSDPLPIVHPAGEPSLRFADDHTLTLSPGETRQVTVIASPPERHTVRFALLGEALDASLDHVEIGSDEGGVAHVLLHAPSQAATFRLRATLVAEDGDVRASAEAGVAVSDLGFGALRILPEYSGKRAIKGWTASVVARTTCQEIAPSLPGVPPGALVASTALDAPIVVSDAPVGPNLAVAIRSGQYMWGCTDTLALKPDHTLDVEVTVVDKPIDLASTDLALDLDFSPDPVAYGELLAAETARVAETFMPDGIKAPALLLTGMADASPDGVAFDTQSNAKDWSAIAEKHLAGLAMSLHDQVTALAEAGLLLGAPKIEANLKATPGEAGAAALTVTTFAGIDQAGAGIPDVVPFSWTADPNDTLILSGIVLFQPSRFIGASAFAGAKQHIPNVATMAEALSQAADCKGFAAKLGGYDGCPTSCIAILCRDALASRWEAALDASLDTGVFGHLNVTAAGPAAITEEAELIGFSGSWVGSVASGAVSASVKGKIIGQETSGGPPP